MSANVIGAMISRVNSVGPHAFLALHPQNWGPRNVNIMVQWINEPAAVRSPGSGCFNYLKKYYNKSTLDNSPPPNYDKESKVECHHVNNNARYKWYVKLAAFQVIAPTRSNYGRKINVKNRNKSTILIFLPAIIELVQELLISNMHNKLEEDTCENVEVIVPTRSNYWRKMRKIAINRPFWIFFQPLLNLSKNYLLVACITNLKRICEKLFKLSRPQGQIIDVKWEKSQ